jgi:hypothetical protein
MRLPKRRLIRILQLPVLAPILLAGCILSFTSEPKAKKTPKRVAAPIFNAQSFKKARLQMSLMQELAEEPIANA